MAWCLLGPRVPGRAKTPTRSPYVDILFAKRPTTQIEMLRPHVLGAMLENDIFYIFVMYEFSHSLVRGDDSGSVCAQKLARARRLSHRALSLISRPVSRVL